MDKVFCKGCDELRSIFKELFSLNVPELEKMSEIVYLYDFNLYVFGYPSINWGNVVGSSRDKSYYQDFGYREVTPEEFKRILSLDKQFTSITLNKKCICCRGSEKLYDVLKRINNYNPDIVPFRVLEKANNPRIMFGYAYGRILCTEDLNYYQNERGYLEVTPEQFEKAWISIRTDSSEQSSIKQNNVSSEKSKSISIENFRKLSLAVKKPLKIIL